MNNSSLHSFEEYQHLKNNKLFIYTLIATPLILAGPILVLQNNPIMLIITGLSGGLLPDMYFNFTPERLIITVLSGGLLPVILLLLAFNTKLETHLDKSGIRYKWIPFQKKSRTISWTSVEKAEVIRYDYIGHGYRRISRKYGTVHNVTGKMGLQIVLESGEKLLIGTQKPEEMNNFLSTLSL